MPRITRFRSQGQVRQVAQQGLPSVPTVDYGGAIGGMLDQVGAAIEQKRQKDDRAFITREMAKLNDANTLRMVDAQHGKWQQFPGVQDSGAGITGAITGSYDQDAEALLERTPDYLRDEVSARLAARRSAFLESAARVEAGSVRKFRMGVTQEAVTSAVTGIQRLPETFDTALADIEADIKASDLSPADKETFLQSARSDAAVAYISGIAERDPERARNVLMSGDFDADIDRKQFAALEGIVDAAINDREAAAENAAREQGAALKRIQAFNQSMLEVDLARGQVGERDITAAFLKKDIDHGAFSSLMQKAIKAQQKAVEDNTAINMVAARMAGGDSPPLLDPGNKDHKKAVDTYYQKQILGAVHEAAQQGASPEEQQAIAQSLKAHAVQRMGMVPETLVGEIRGKLQMGSPEQTHEAIDMMMRVQEANPMAYERAFSSQNRAFAAFAADAMRAGADPAFALEAAREATDSTNEARNKLRMEEARAVDFEDHVDAAVAAMALSGTFAGIESDFFKGDADFTEQEKDELGIAYRDLYEMYYRHTGDEEQANKLAAESLKTRFGVTEVNGEKRLMMDAPERHFPTVGGNHDWLQSQLSETLTEAGIITETADGQVVIISDQVVPTGAPQGTAPGPAPEFASLPAEDQSPAAQAERLSRLPAVPAAQPDAEGTTRPGAELPTSFAPETPIEGTGLDMRAVMARNEQAAERETALEAERVAKAKAEGTYSPEPVPLEEAEREAELAAEVDTAEAYERIEAEREAIPSVFERPVTEIEAEVAGNEREAEAVSRVFERPITAVQAEVAERQVPERDVPETTTANLALPEPVFSPGFEPLVKPGVVSLVPDDRTRREAASGYPSYQLMTTKDGIIEPLRDKAGKPVRFRPNPTNAMEKFKAEKAAQFAEDRISEIQSEENPDVFDHIGRATSMREIGKTAGEVNSTIDRVLSRFGLISQPEAEGETRLPVETAPTPKPEPAAKSDIKLPGRKPDMGDWVPSARQLSQQQMNSMANNLLHTVSMPTGIAWPTLMAKIGQKESAGKTYAVPKTDYKTSVYGLYQFSKAAWDDVLTKEGGAELGLKDFEKGKRDPKQQTLAAMLFARRNYRELAKVMDTAPTDGDIYLAHFMGLAGAKKILAARDDALAKDHASSTAVRNNKSVFQIGGKWRTVAQLRKWAARAVT